MQVLGPYGVNNNAERADNTNDQRSGRNRHVGQAAVGGQHKYTTQRQHNGEHLKQPRRTLLLDADHQQNQHGGKILQNGAHTGAGKLDGQKVGELAKADASQAIDHKVARVAPAAPGVHQLAPVAHTVIDAQNHTGQKQPDGHQPGGIHALAGKQILPHAAGNTPAHAAEHCQQSAFYAIRHSL